MADQVSDEVMILMEERVKSLDVLSDNCCIYKIPACIKKGREEFYRPSAVSIGPIYYKDPSLETMQEQKWTYLKHFLDHPWNANNSLKHFIEFVREKETIIRDCYEENKHFSSKEFIQMIVLDAAFIICIFIGSCNFDVDKMPVVEKNQGLAPYVSKDLILLENQLPFFVLLGFFALAFGHQAHHQVKYRENVFIKTAVECISVNFLGYNVDSNLIVEFMKCCPDPTTIKHLLDLLRSCCCASPIRSRKLSRATTYPMTARELSKKGVKFGAIRERTTPLHVSFRDGMFLIPELVLDTDTEPYVRNLLYFEQRHYPENSYINDLMLFIDKLIDTVEDVQILQEAGILINQLGSNQDAIKFFNNAGNTVGSLFYYSKVSREANAYASSSCSKWMELLWSTYFRHPWAIISLIATIILFILTLLQTIAAFTK